MSSAVALPYDLTRHVAIVTGANHGITANLVHPPVTDTGWVTDVVRDHVEKRPDLIQVVEPEAVAEVVVWLCSDQARLVTANVVHLR